MAVVAAYNFDSLLPSGDVPDMAGYGRSLVLDSGVVLGAGYAGRGLQCDAGGGSAAYGSGDYVANSASFSCFARVRSLSSTHALRVIAENKRGTDRVQQFLLSDTNGDLAVVLGVAGLSPIVRSSGVSVLDGEWHHVGVAYDALDSGDLTFWVDGTVVSTTNLGTGAEGSQAGLFTIGRATDSATTHRVDAVIDDLRWFNDPVYVGEASLFTPSVENLVTAAYAFDESGSTVEDYTLRQNDLGLTANGSRAAAVHNDGLFSSGGHGAEGDVTLWTGGAFDRLTVCGWVRVTTEGSAAEFLSLENASSTPKFQLFRGGANALLFKAWGDSAAAPFDGNYLFVGDGALSTSAWRFFFVNINPTGYELRVYDAGGTVLATTNGGTGNPPTNEPIISGITKLRLGGGVAALDDVRIVRNYLNDTAVVGLLSEPVTQEPGPILADAPTGSLTLSASAVVASSGSGSLTLSGSATGTAQAVVTASGELELLGVASGSWSQSRTASGGLSASGFSDPLVFEGQHVTSALGVLPLTGVGAAESSFQIELTAAGVLVLSGVSPEPDVEVEGDPTVVLFSAPPREVSLDGLGLGSPYTYMAGWVSPSLLKIEGTFRTLDEPSGEDLAAASVAYLGGRTYEVTVAEAEDLVAAGYGDWIHDAPLPYGTGLYGVGAYGLGGL